MKTQIHDEPRLVAAAERRMQNWVRTQEIEDRVVHSPHQRPMTGISQITVSREAGAGGGEIALRVGGCLGWPVLDRNLMDQVAERFNEPRMMLDLVDETPSNWVYDVLGTWMDRTIITHERYVAHLTRVVLAAARHGSFVLVGRGGQFLLPRDKTLAVRIVASEKYRIERIMRIEGLRMGDARRRMQEIDRGRQDFVLRFFHHDVNDPRLYDLVLNVERLGVDTAVQQVLTAVAPHEPGRA